MGDWADDCERQAEFEEDERLDFLRRVNEARANVIEAARAWAATAGNARHHTLEDLALYETIEALEKVEDEPW